MYTIHNCTIIDKFGQVVAKCPSPATAALLMVQLNGYQYLLDGENALDANTFDTEGV